MSIRRNENVWWVHLFLVIACIIAIFPLYRVFTVAIQPGDKIFSTSFRLWPAIVTTENFVRVFQETNFVRWISNSVIITALSAFISVTLSTTAGYALSRYRFPMRTGLFMFLMVTQMMPAVMLLLPLYFVLRHLSLIDSYVGVILVYLMTTVPFCVWLLKGYFDTIPRSLEQAAQVDGLTEAQAFWKVVLPLSTPSLAIAMLFSVVQVWNEYIVARVILQTSELYTWPLGLFELQGEYDTKWGMFAAASFMVTIPVTVFFLYSSRWLLSGLTVGSVKG